MHLVGLELFLNYADYFHFKEMFIALNAVKEMYLLTI